MAKLLRLYGLALSRSQTFWIMCVAPKADICELWWSGWWWVCDINRSTIKHPRITYASYTSEWDSLMDGFFDFNVVVVVVAAERVVSKKSPWIFIYKTDFLLSLTNQYFEMECHWFWGRVSEYWFWCVQGKKAYNKIINDFNYVAKVLSEVILYDCFLVFG